MENSLAGGSAGAEILLERAAPPSAVFAASDEIAFGALRSFREHGLRVPGDISIVGFDNHAFADVVGLTTVDQDTATACVRQALNLGITTFDTADAYAATRAESTLGEKLASVCSEWTVDEIRAGGTAGTGTSPRTS